MTTVQKKKILIRVQQLEADISTLKQVLFDLATQEYVSATLASQGGSKSFTRRGIGDVERAIEILKNELKQCRKLLRGVNGIQPDTQYITWS